MSVKVKYFVHGTTTDNLEHKATGWLPGELSQKGIEQSKALRELIDIGDISIVFCSDLQRAIDSAHNIFRDDREIIEDMRLRECNYGDYNGQDSKFAIYETHITDRFPNGENMQDVENRMRAFCKFLIENYDGKTVAIVAHKAPQLALEVLTQNKTWKEAIDTDWRKTKAWQPGWEYIIEK